MVSEKVVVILIIVAILLSIISVVVTVSSVNNVNLKPVPPKVNINKIPSGPDSEEAQVAITVSSQS